MKAELGKRALLLMYRLSDKDHIFSGKSIERENCYRKESVLAAHKKSNHVSITINRERVLLSHNTVRTK